MGVKGLTMDNDMEKSEKEKMDIFHQYVKGKKEGEKLTQTDEKEILTEAERLEIVNKATIVLCEVILDGEKVQRQKYFVSNISSSQQLNIYNLFE